MEIPVGLMDAGSWRPSSNGWSSAPRPPSVEEAAGFSGRERCARHHPGSF